MGGAVTVDEKPGASERIGAGPGAKRHDVLAERRIVVHRSDDPFPLRYRSSPYNILVLRLIFVRAQPGIAPADELSVLGQFPGGL